MGLVDFEQSGKKGRTHATDVAPATTALSNEDASSGNNTQARVVEAVNPGSAPCAAAQVTVNAPTERAENAQTTAAPSVLISVPVGTGAIAHAGPGSAPCAAAGGGEHAHAPAKRAENADATAAPSLVASAAVVADGAAAQDANTTGTSGRPVWSPDIPSALLPPDIDARRLNQARSNDDNLAAIEFARAYRALECVKIPCNPSRLNVKTHKSARVRGMCLGCVNARGGGIIASSHTRKMPRLAKLLVEFGRRSLPADFTFTSIQVNKNYMSAMHVDKSNLGDSYIVGLGEYEGGDLWVHRQKYRLLQNAIDEHDDSRMTRAGWELPWHAVTGDVERVSVRRQWRRFDGNMPHCTLPYSGTRYTLIFYTQQSYALMEPATRQYLEAELGFPVPKAGLVKPAYPRQIDRLKAAVAAFAAWRVANNQNESVCRHGPLGLDACWAALDAMVGVLPPAVILSLESRLVRVRRSGGVKRPRDEDAPCPDCPYQRQRELKDRSGRVKSHCWRCLRERRAARVLAVPPKATAVRCPQTT